MTLWKFWEFWLFIESNSWGGGIPPPPSPHQSIHLARYMNEHVMKFVSVVHIKHYFHEISNVQWAVSNMVILCPVNQYGYFFLNIRAKRETYWWINCENYFVSECKKRSPADRKSPLPCWLRISKCHSVIGFCVSSSVLLPLLSIQRQWHF